MAQIVKADMRHIQIFKQLSKLGRYPRRGDRGTVRLRYNKVIVIVRLSVLFCLFALRLRDLMSYDELELDTLGDRKTALFLIMSDTDSTFNFVIAMLQSQLFNSAIYLSNWSR